MQSSGRPDAPFWTQWSSVPLAATLLVVPSDVHARAARRVAAEGKAVSRRISHESRAAAPTSPPRHVARRAAHAAPRTRRDGRDGRAGGRFRAADGDARGDADAGEERPRRAGDAALRRAAAGAPAAHRPGCECAHTSAR